jgi:hypothetical protein
MNKESEISARIHIVSRTTKGRFVKPFSHLTCKRLIKHNHLRDSVEGATTEVGSLGNHTMHNIANLRDAYVTAPFISAHIAAFLQEHGQCL